AWRQLHGLAFVALDQDRRAARRGYFVYIGGGGGHQLVLGREAPRHHRGQPLAQPDVGQDLVARTRARTARQLLPGGGVGGRQFQVQFLQGLFEQAFAESHGFFVLDRAQVVADFRARAAGAYVVEPLRIGAGCGRGDDLDRVAAAQFGAQRNEFVVDLGRHGLVADIGVDGIREIDRRGATRQRDDLAARGEYIDGVREQVDLDVLEEFAGIARLALDVEQRLQPLVRALLKVVERHVGALVQPVRRHAFFGNVVHVARAELEFHGRAIRPHQRGVQRLVAVDLGNGDVVFELAGHRPVQLVQRAQGQVALGQRVHDDPKAVDVEHFGKRLSLLDHLGIDAVQRFFAACNLGFDAGGGQGGAYRVADLADDFAAVAARGQHRLVQHLVAVGIHGRETQVL